VKEKESEREEKKERERKEERMTAHVRSSLNKKKED